MPTVAISGYYGLGNLGDEAILAGTVAGFRAAHPTLRLVALSADPAATRSLHGIEAVHRYSLPAVWSALRSADLLLSGGGGLLQDTTSLRSPLYYLGVMRLADFLGVPVMVFAQGIGPLRRPLVPRVARRVLDRTALASVRDAASADALRALGVSRPPVHVTADASLMMPPPPPGAAGTAWERAGVEPPPSPRIGVCVRPWPQPDPDRWAAGLRQALEAAARSLNASLVLIPMQRPGDERLSQQIASGIEPPAAVCAPRTPAEAMALLGEMDLVVAMRLHALILACAQGVPSLGLSYDPKVRAFLETVDQPCLDLEADPQTVRHAVQSAFEAGEGAAAGLRAAADPLRRAAARNVDLALALLACCSR